MVAECGSVNSSNNQRTEANKFNYHATSCRYVSDLFCCFLLIEYESTPSTSSCGVQQFECRDDHRCIEVNRVADGVRDCADGSDECNDGRFRCKCGIPVCIDRIFVMDGQIHCEDGSDEGLGTTSACISNELTAGK